MNYDAPRIRQVIFHLETRQYKFDVNQTVTIHGLKRIIVAAANLGKRGLKIYHNQEDITDFDDDTLSQLFPDQQTVEFNLAIEAPPVELESRIKLKLGDYCPVHEIKYMYFYCYTCKLSLCSLCVQGNEHKIHNVIEKYDYLQGSRNLVEKMFTDLNDYISNCKVDKKLDADKLKEKLRMDYFPSLADMLMKIEEKFIDLIDSFNEKSEISLAHIKSNVELIKAHCSSGLDKLKEEIKIEDMLLNEEIFLTFDHKYHEITNEKNRITADKKKYEELHASFKIISDKVEKSYNEIFVFLDGHIKDPIYSSMKSRLFENSIALVEKDEIERKILSDVKLKKHSGRKSAMDKSSVSHREFDNSFMQSKASNNVNNNNLMNFPKSSLDSIFRKNDAATSLNVSSSSPVPHNPHNTHNMAQLIAESIAKESLNYTREKTATKETTTLIETKETLILQAQNLIMRPAAETKEIVIFNDENNTLTRRDIVFPQFCGIDSFLPNSSWINHLGKLYVSGGQIDSENSSNSFFVYDLIKDSLVKLPDMQTGRHSHSMLFDDNFIYVVGGYKNSTTEKFDILLMKWVKLNNLFMGERQLSVLYAHNNYLYSFFGYTIGGFMDSVEKLNTKSPKSKWELMPFKNPDKIDLKLIGCGIVPYNDKEVYFFGGKGKDGVRKEAFKFDFSMNTFTRTEITLDDGTFFQETSLVDLGDACWGQFDFETGDHFLRIQLG